MLVKMGEAYLDEEKIVYNRLKVKRNLIDVYTYDLYDNKMLPPLKNQEAKDLDLIDVYWEQNKSFLFPVIPLNSPSIKEVKDVSSKISKSIKILSEFVKDSDFKIEALDACLKINGNFLKSIHEHIKGAYSNGKQEKINISYFTFSYKGKLVTSFFDEIYEKYINRELNCELIDGYDFINNSKKVGADAFLPFCSVAQLPDRFKDVKKRLLSLSPESAKRARLGFVLLENYFSVNFNNRSSSLLMAVMPTLIGKDITEYRRILELTEDSRFSDSDNALDTISEHEGYVNTFLESLSEKELENPVLNNILFYEKSNSARNLLLQIDDVLPSYVTYIAKELKKYNIMATYRKECDKSVIFLDRLFESPLEVMNFLLSRKKQKVSLFIEKYAKLITKGTIKSNNKGIKPKKTDWLSTFMFPDSYTGIHSINRYQQFFNSIGVLDKNIIFYKEENLNIKVSSETNAEEYKQHIETLLDNNEYVREKRLLKISYFLGMLSGIIQNRELGAFGYTRYGKLLNTSRKISTKSIEKIYKNCRQALMRLDSKGMGSGILVNIIEEELCELFKKGKASELCKDEQMTIAFTLGGVDFRKYLKVEK